MTVQADSTFVNDRHDAETYDDRDWVALGRIHVARTFRGDLEGTSTAELLTAMTASGSAVYVAFDRVDGTLHYLTLDYELEPAQAPQAPPER
jgi:Protein of unknown function (DUF3224)